MLDLESRVVLVTGAGRGLGREHALLLARNGARVVVNDYAGPGTESSVEAGHPAHDVVEEIRAEGDEAWADGRSVTDWDGMQRLVEESVERYGTLDAVVNNAGILRDRTIANITEQEWDDVVDVHMKGTCAVGHAAAAYWRAEAKSGSTRDRAVVNTSSGSGLLFSPGQTNYAAAKAGIVAMTMVWAKELERYGVRCNAIAPMARTRLTMQTPGMDEMLVAPEQGFDAWDPANISPLIAYLVSPDCVFNGGVFHVVGGQIGIFDAWQLRDTIELTGRWELAALADALGSLVGEQSSDRLTSEAITPAEVLAQVEAHAQV